MRSYRENCCFNYVNGKCQIIRLVLKVLAGIVGLFGFMSLYFSLHFILLAAKGPEDSGGFRVANSLVCFLMGLYFLFVCYIMLRKFSIRSLSHFSAILTLFLLGGIFNFLGSIFERLIERNDILGVLIGLAPLVLIVLFYMACKRLLVRLTGLS